MSTGAYTLADIDPPKGQYTMADIDKGPTIGPKRPSTPPFPGADLAAKAADYLTQAANLTQEGRAQHPAQAMMGDFASRLKQWLVGGTGGGENLKTGFLTNPVTSTLIAQPGEAIDAAAELAGGATRKVGSLLGTGTEVGRAVTQKLSPEVANAPVSLTRGASSGGAATSITPSEVLQHAHDMGISLTPAQALQTSAAKSEQVFGEEAILTGGKIKEAITQSKGKLADEVEAFQDKLDPKRVGLSPEAAGEHLQNSAEIARGALKDNVNYAYDQVREQQADLAADVQTPMKNFLDELTIRRQPHAAVARPVTQTAAAKSAINDIQGLLQDPGLEGRASVESLRNLRTTLLEKGNDYGTNALADSGQRIYKLAASKVDDAIMEAAKGTDFEPTFRAAGEQNAKLQSLYNTRGSPLYRILNTDDPAAVADGILNRSSVHEIETLKSENFDLGPLARQAVEDIKNGGYRVTSTGMGGYPDSFLRSLLGPDATKELYLKGEIARRLAENYNPSGSGKVLLGASQVFHPVAAAGAQVARIRSMPQPAMKYLGLGKP